jgi:hypothetical protein
MHRLYVLTIMLSLGAFAYGQYNGMSLFDSEEGVQLGRTSSLSSRHK